MLGLTLGQQLDLIDTEQKIRVYRNSALILQGTLKNIPWSDVRPYERHVVRRIISNDDTLCIRVDYVNSRSNLERFV